MIGHYYRGRTPNQGKKVFREGTQKKILSSFPVSFTSMVKSETII